MIGVAVYGANSGPYAFHAGWCSWTNQCGGAQHGDGYWLESQVCYNEMCMTPGTMNDSCTFDPPHCGDHCYDSDAIWHLQYSEVYDGTQDCSPGSGTISYFGAGCVNH
jgi:hypothetical protein